MHRARTILEVLEGLSGIISRCRLHQNRAGYFAILYYRMTLAVKKGIANNLFEDAPRMERLMVIFANRYLQAWHQYQNHLPCTNAWCAVFDAAKKNNLVVLQHLLLGINTHINLDLGIAAAETAPGEAIHDLQKDFDRINDVIAGLINDVQESLAKIWFPLRYLQKIANKREEAVLNFSLSTARKTAWANALTFSMLNEQQDQKHIQFVDNKVTVIANRIINPRFAVSFILKPVLFMESKDVSRNMDHLLDEPRLS